MDFRRPGFGLVAFIYLLITLLYPRIYWAADAYLPRNSYELSYLLFSYIGDWIRYIGRFPDWVFTGQGGVWIEPLGHNYLSVFPPHWIGFVAARFTAWDLNFIYKVCFLVIGQLVYLLGIYRLAGLLFESQEAKFLVTLLALVTSVSCIHNEQAFSTVFFVPWIGYLVCRAKTSPAFWIPAGCLAGMSLNSTYPQYLFLYFGIVGVFWILTQLKSRAQFPRWAMLAALGSALMCASPTLYEFGSFKDKLASSFREQEGGIGFTSYEKYQSIVGLDYTSSFPSDLALYIRGWDHLAAKRRIRMDDKVFFASAAVPLAILTVLAIPSWHAAIQLLILVALSFCTLGIHSGAPRLLWNILPGIEYFRQWYGLAPLVSLHLIFLIGLAFELLQKRSHPKRTLLVGLVLFAAWGFGGMDWKFGLLPAVLMGVRAFSIVKFKQLGAAWLILTSVGWMHSTLTEFEGRLISPIAPPVGKNPDFMSKLFFLFGTELLQTVNPNSSDSKAIATHFATGGVKWQRGEELLPVLAEDIRFSPKGDRFEIQWRQVPAGVTSLNVLQTDDGNWRYSFDGENYLATQRSELGTVLIPIEPGKRIVAFRREKSWWGILQGVSAVTALLGLLLSLVRYEHARNAAGVNALGNHFRRSHAN